MFTGLSPDQAEFKTLVSELIELLRTGRSSSLMRSLCTYDLSVAGQLFYIFRSRESGLGPEIEKYWENIRVLAGIIVKNYISHESLPLYLLQRIAPEVFVVLRFFEVKISRLAAAIVAQITKRCGLDMWSSLSPPIHLMKEIWDLLNFENGVLYYLLQYMIEDNLELIIEENADFFESLVWGCSKDYRLIPLLHTCYLKGNLFDWLIEREYWTPVQKSLAACSERTVRLVTHLIEEENFTHVNEIMNLMAALVEYQELCFISYDIACAWTLYVAQKCMVVEANETPFYESGCWYIIQVRDAYIDEDVENFFRRAMHEIPVELLLPFLVQKLVLRQEDIESLLTGDNELENIVAMQDQEDEILESVNLLTVSYDRYLAAKCIECLSFECPEKLFSFLIGTSALTSCEHWELQEALVLTHGLVGQHANGNELYDEMLIIDALVRDNTQNPILRSTSAFALAKFIKNYTLVLRISKESLCHTLFSGASSENFLLGVYSLRGLMSIVQVCLEENISTKLDKKLIRNIMRFLVDFVQSAGIEAFLLAMTILETCLRRCPVMDANISFPWNFMIGKLELTIDTMPKYASCLVFVSILRAIESAIAGHHPIDTKNIDLIIIIAYKALEGYLTNSNGKEEDIYIRSVQLWLIILQQFPRTKNFIPLDFIREVVSHAINSENDSKIKVIARFISCMIAEPVLSGIVSDLNEKYLPVLMNLVGKSEATSDILECLTQCSHSMLLSQSTVDRILEVLCVYLDKSSCVDEYEVQVCAICIASTLNLLVEGNPSYFGSLVTTSWNKKVRVIMKILRVVPNNEKKCQSAQGIIRYILLGLIEIKPLVEDLILLLASFHETIQNSMQLNILASRILNIVKNDSVLEKEYSTIIQRRRLRNFEEKFSIV